MTVASAAVEAPQQNALRAFSSNDERFAELQEPRRHHDLQVPLEGRERSYG
jgi:hypothetical protein